jgi:hypothetical protein
MLPVSSLNSEQQQNYVNDMRRTMGHHQIVSAPFLLSPATTIVASCFYALLKAV